MILDNFITNKIAAIHASEIETFLLEEAEALTRVALFKYSAQVGREAAPQPTLQSHASSTTLSTHKRRLSTGNVSVRPITLKESRSSSAITPAKFTNEFVHSGFNWSKRKGEIVVVDNNAISKNAIRPSTGASNNSGRNNRVRLLSAKGESDAGTITGASRTAASTRGFEGPIKRNVMSASSKLRTTQMRRTQS